MVAAAVVGAVGSVAAGAISSSNAASAQEAAAQQANATQMAMFQQAQQNLAPYNTVGQNALTQANAITSAGGFNFKPTMASIAQTPGYQFNLTQGLKGVENSAAARGLGNSGAALKGAANFATGLADSTYQNQFNNALTGYQTNINNLLGQAQIGEAAGAGVASGAITTGQGVANNLIGAGNAQAAADMKIGNSVSNAATNIGQSYMLNQLLSNNFAATGAPFAYGSGGYTGAGPFIPFGSGS